MCTYVITSIQNEQCRVKIIKIQFIKVGRTKQKNRKKYNYVTTNLVFVAFYGIVNYATIYRSEMDFAMDMITDI